MTAGGQRVYTYLFADILTNRVLAELPCYGTFFTRELSGTGNMTASVAMNASGYSNRDIKNATTPGKCALYALCNDVVIWSGPIWSRTYSNLALSMTGQTWESWAYKFYPTATLTYSNVEQRNIVIDLLTQMQAVTGQSALFTLPPNYPMQVGRTENFPVNDLKSYGELVEYMSNFDIGFDYEIFAQVDSSGVLQRYLRMGNPALGATQNNSGLIFEFPGSIISYIYSENAADSAIKVFGVGAGDGPATLRSTATQADLAAGGAFPLLQSVYTNKDVTLQPTLDAQTRAFGKRKRTPLVSWTLEIDPALDPLVGTWGLGDSALITVEDPGFFPDSAFQGYIRPIGWELTPPSSQNKESLRLILESADDNGQ